jgi:hypothetical protein
MCGVKTEGGIQCGIDGDRRISVGPEVAGRKDSKRNAAIMARRHTIPCYRGSTLLETENQSNMCNGIGKRREAMDSNRGCT